MARPRATKPRNNGEVETARKRKSPSSPVPSGHPRLGDAVASPTGAGTESTLGAPTPKYELPQDELEDQHPQVTDSPEAVLPLKKYVPGSASGGPAPTQPLRFRR